LRRFIKRLGVDRVINYRREKVRAVLKAEFKQGRA
jgi:NADPH-dependent curcumin reductase CurA